jgi:hypothetical protein
MANAIGAAPAFRMLVKVLVFKVLSPMAELRVDELGRASVHELDGAATTDESPVQQWETGVKKMTKL